MDTHDIVLKADGEIVRGLEIDSVEDGIRDRSMFPKEVRGAGLGVLVEPARIRFRTPSRKVFALSFDQFSFLINHAA